MTAMSTPADPLLRVVLNLSQFHREHEKFYSESPLQDAITLQRASRGLKALAERWSTADAQEAPVPSPFAGATDLNDDRATETLGILFMEGEDEPAEIARLKTDLAALAKALQRNRRMAGERDAGRVGHGRGAAEYPGLADLLAERHRIIANDWQAASLATLAARHVERALDVLGRVDFAPAALRADLGGERIAPRYVFSAAELIDHAADLIAESATLTHENERRWRVFHARVEELTAI